MSDQFEQFESEISEVPQTDPMDVSDLFEDDEDEDEVEPFGNAPVATVLMPGSRPIPVVLAPGMTVGQVLGQAHVNLPAGTRDVWVNGQVAGLDTPVEGGASITAVGAVKGG